MKHTHTHILARLGSCRNWSDGFWLIVCKCWNIINPHFLWFGKVCAHAHLRVLLWEIISGRWKEPWPLLQGQRGEVKQHRLLPLLLVSFLSSLVPLFSPSSSLEISFNAHLQSIFTPFSVSLFLSRLRKTKVECGAKNREENQGKWRYSKLYAIQDKY